MPELPEVETIVRELVTVLQGSVVRSITVATPKLRYPVPNLSHLVGETILGVSRRGKYILIKFKEGILLSHLGMTGKWVERDGQNNPEKHDHVYLIACQTNLKDICFSYNDVRRFGFMEWIEKDSQSQFLNRLGPEPLDNWSVSDFQKVLLNRKSAIKKVIMDNSVVVGVGNIYASEALFRAKIHPEKKSSSLKIDEIKKLHQCIRDVLLEGIEAKGASVNTYRRTKDDEGHMSLKLNVYGRTGEPCAVCKNPISSKILGGRNTFWCPRCQKDTHSKKCPENLSERSAGQKNKKSLANDPIKEGR